MLVFLQIVYGSLYFYSMSIKPENSREKMKNPGPFEACIA
jgi:hypothetical protein